MSKLKDVVYGSQEKLDSLFNGQTVSGHTYNENDLYIEELGDDIELGANGSGLTINNSNQLVADVKSVSVSASGTATDEVSYITINGVEKKLAGGSGGSYTAGNGIDITNNVISADLAVSDIPSLPLTKISDVTATASEVNVLDGITATTQELNTLDGITSTTSELNMLHGTTEYTAAEIDTLWEETT